MGERCVVSQYRLCWHVFAVLIVIIENVLMGKLCSSVVADLISTVANCYILWIIRRPYFSPILSIWHLWSSIYIEGPKWDVWEEGPCFASYLGHALAHISHVSCHSFIYHHTNDCVICVWAPNIANPKTYHTENFTHITRTHKHVLILWNPPSIEVNSRCVLISVCCQPISCSRVELLHYRIKISTTNAKKEIWNKDTSGVWILLWWGKHYGLVPCLGTELEPLSIDFRFLKGNGDTTFTRSASLKQKNRNSRRENQFRSASI